MNFFGLGFLETPYRKVIDGLVDLDNPAQFLSAEGEDTKRIAQANAPLNETGAFLTDRIKSREQGEFPVLASDEIEFMDVAPNQIVGVSASLIPFLENDDANRALMGSNMQRQALPLIRPSSPVVGTGLEGQVARDSRMLILRDYPARPLCRGGRRRAVLRSHYTQTGLGSLCAMRQCCKGSLPVPSQSVARHEESHATPCTCSR